MNIIISGALGAMGRVVGTNAPKQSIDVVAGVDRVADNSLAYPVYDSFDKCSKADVIIDFSHPSTLPALLAYAKSSHTPVVIATTGMSEEDINLIHQASKEIPVFFTFNMSLGINLLVTLAQKATEVLGQGFDIEIVEKHHNQKIDAPSGTAVMLANAIAETTPFQPEFVYDRHSVRQKRNPNEIGMHAIRGGTIVGEHEVIFAGMDEVITLSHSAYSKGVFAIGALKAAKYLVTVNAGLYDMKNMLEAGK